MNVYRKHVTSYTNSQLFTVCHYKDAPHMWKPRRKLNISYFGTLSLAKAVLVEKILYFCEFLSQLYYYTNVWEDSNTYSKLYRSFSYPAQIHMLFIF